MGYRQTSAFTRLIGFFEAQARYQVGLDASALNMIRREWGIGRKRAPNNRLGDDRALWRRPTDWHESVGRWLVEWRDAPAHGICAWCGTHFARLCDLHRHSASR